MKSNSAKNRKVVATHTQKIYPKKHYFVIKNCAWCNVSAVHFFRSPALPSLSTCGFFICYTRTKRQNFHIESDRILCSERYINYFYSFIPNIRERAALFSSILSGAESPPLGSMFIKSTDCYEYFTDFFSSQFVASSNFPSIE